MQKTINLRLLPSEAVNEQLVRKYIAMEAGVSPASIKGFNILKQSIDARGKITRINFSLQAFINESPVGRVLQEFSFLDVNKASEQAIIIGAGPAGLFAALRLLEKGIRPVIIERGKDVRSRRRDLARLNKEGEVNPESNYCFGEGGAGTYSDGKLYTRSSKRGDVNRILELFVRFGADERILYEAHPHIGTNKLPQIITAMRKMILDCGGKIHFEHKLTDIDVENGRLKGIRLNNGELLGAKAVILATGHSARDIFLILKARNITIEAKPFALGVRVEHPQSLIDISQYHLAGAGGIILQKDPNLPPASYTWVQQVDGKGVFSFCMCPGGIIAPAATSPGELVVNGWSPSRRNNPFANSGIVVTVDPADAMHHFQQQRLKIKADDPLLLMRFQEDIERKAFEAGGGKFVAPAMRLVDFTENRISNSLPDCSYLPGIIPAHLKNVLPAFIHARLRQAFTEYGKKMKGYLTNEAVAVATESRTSSPVRIPRDPASLQHPQVKGLFPCGEGAGYAGGIVSAAMDGERIAEAVASLLVSRSSH